MDKNAIKKYAVWARRELISRVSQKAMQFGITEKNIVDASADSVNGHLLSPPEKRQRQALIAKIKDEDYELVMEEVAFTWFNRFIALRFMEVNGYLPSHVRVFTDENNAFNPQILAEAIHLEMDGLIMDKVYAFKDANQTDELYKYLIITQCNALNSILPGMFQRIEDYTELLFPDNILRDGSAVEQMITQIAEDDWKDAVQIIGWLYQYYNTEPKDKVFADLKKNIKISKENIPAATQLFTPDWIVRYMVENSLGRLWVEGHPNDELKAGWKYYLEEVEQEPDVQKQLVAIREEYKELTPDQIKCIDPCMGSGHILVYMFDVLMQIYEAYGYTTREAVSSIINNNLYGLDIDDRAAQLAYFAVMMKARQYDGRFFSRKSQPHVYAICESNGISTDTVASFCKGDADLKKSIKTIMDELHDAKEYGSILTITPQDWVMLFARFDEIRNEEVIELNHDTVMNELLPLVQVAEVLAQKYGAVITNPPYMGSSGMSPKLSEFVKNQYPDGKADLFAVFMQRADKFVAPNCFTSLITMETWMFLSGFEKLRSLISTDKTITNMVHMPYLGKGGTSLGINFGTAAVVMKKGHIHNYMAQYEYTVYYETDENGVPFVFPTVNNRWNASTQENFKNIPGAPIAYWISDQFRGAFDNKKLGDIGSSSKGIITGDNNRFLRLWFEVENCNIKFDATSYIDAEKSDLKWYPCRKGGASRKWYGNNEYIINWMYNGYEVLVCAKAEKRNCQDYSQDFKFIPSISWTSISTGKPSFRFGEHDLSESAGMSYFTSKENLFRVLGFLNSIVCLEYLSILAPTMNYTAGAISSLPILSGDKELVEKIVAQCIDISKIDWDFFETSWDFTRHPLICGERTVAAAFLKWECEASDRFEMLKANEEELNRIFINIYGLQDELTPEVADKDVTVRTAVLGREVRSLISYAVGCMFGRYSLYNDGLLYAGGPGGDMGSLVEKIQDSLKSQGLSMFPDDEFYPDTDNIIPVCDDEYFDDDIVGRFVKFIEVIYGKETLDENLRFISDALGGIGSPKDAIRSYFLNDFYSDHLKIYQKRPIYWLFDSGKNDGFKAITYMHRYQPDTIARMRTDYVHEQQARYRTALIDLEQRIAGASTSERVKLNKQLAKLQEQEAEIREYEEKIHHLADQMIRIDMDDGVKHNYEIFNDVLAPIK